MCDLCELAAAAGGSSARQGQQLPGAGALGPGEEHMISSVS